MRGLPAAAACNDGSSVSLSMRVGACPRARCVRPVPASWPCGPRCESPRPRRVGMGMGARVIRGRVPSGERGGWLRVASDYPTEFSIGIAQNVGRSSPLGPYFVHRSEDDMIVGEIGGAFID